MCGCHANQPHQSQEHHTLTLHTERPRNSVRTGQQNGHRVCKVRQALGAGPRPRGTDPSHLPLTPAKPRTYTSKYPLCGSRGSRARQGRCRLGRPLSAMRPEPSLSGDADELIPAHRGQHARSGGPMIPAQAVHPGLSSPPFPFAPGRSFPFAPGRSSPFAPGHGCGDRRQRRAAVTARGGVHPAGR